MGPHGNRHGLSQPGQGKPELLGDRVLIDPRKVMGDGANAYKS